MNNNWFLVLIKELTLAEPDTEALQRMSKDQAWLQHATEQPIFHNLDIIEGWGMEEITQR